MDRAPAHPDNCGEPPLAVDPGAVDMEEYWEQRLHTFRAGHEERMLTIGEQVWRYLTGGAGERAALLLHGSSGDGESLFGLMSSLERVYRVVAPTYPDGAHSITAVVDGLAQLLHALETPPALVVGYSLGGYLAQALAWRHPACVAGLALLNTGGPVPGAVRGESLQNALLAAAPGGVVRVAARAGAAALLSLEAPGLDRGAASFWRGYFAEMTRRVGKRRMLTHGRLVIDFLSGPIGLEPTREGWPEPATLIVNSARDRIIEPAELRALDALYPHAARTLEPNAGHLSVLTQPERYLAHIEAAFPSPRAVG